MRLPMLLAAATPASLRTASAFLSSSSSSPSSKQSLSALKLSQLKQIAIQCGINSSGTKHALAQRITQAVDQLRHLEHQQRQQRDARWREYRSQHHHLHHYHHYHELPVIAGEDHANGSLKCRGEHGGNYGKHDVHDASHVPELNNNTDEHNLGSEIAEEQEQVYDAVLGQDGKGSTGRSSSQVGLGGQQQQRQQLRKRGPARMLSERQKVLQMAAGEKDVDEGQPEQFQGHSGREEERREGGGEGASHGRQVRVLSIDMGIRNLAYCVLDASPEHPPTNFEVLPPPPRTAEIAVEAWTRIALDAAAAVSTTASTSAITAANDDVASGKESFEPSVYARHAYAFLTRVLRAHAPITHILIERQRFRSGSGAAVQEWTLRVNMFEAMLYAVLHTLAAGASSSSSFSSPSSSSSSSPSPAFTSPDADEKEEDAKSTTHRRYAVEAREERAGAEASELMPTMGFFVHGVLPRKVNDFWLLSPASLRSSSSLLSSPSSLASPSAPSTTLTNPRARTRRKNSSTDATTERTDNKLDMDKCSGNDMSRSQQIAQQRKGEDKKKKSKKNNSKIAKIELVARLLRKNKTVTATTCVSSGATNAAANPVVASDNVDKSSLDDGVDDGDNSGGGGGGGGSGEPGGSSSFCSALPLVTFATPSARHTAAAFLARTERPRVRGRRGKKMSIGLASGRNAASDNGGGGASREAGDSGSSSSPSSSLNPATTTALASAGTSATAKSAEEATAAAAAAVKLDDLADCLLQGLAWLEWQANMRRLAHEGPRAILGG